MKIVTYNVNGLRNRISQFGSLLKLLESLDADIVCFQETKLSRHELRADWVRADGYESFFSCTRTVDKGRTGYSGVATFCRVKSAFSSDEVALPLAAEEGFTGLLENSQGFGIRKDESPTIAEGLEGFSRDDLLKLDCEGRCIITDHGHFVLFNVYGPRAGSDDADRIHFKLTFFKILQRRWESLFDQGRRIFVVGDLNIAPAAVDRCDAEPDFEKNEFRTWFRSLLVENGGYFFDVFRAKHPERRDAYTCWPTNTGAVEFNFGSRIDHILGAGSCLHKDYCLQGHDFVTCHVKECEILTHFKRWKPGNTPRQKTGKSVKLEGSDHVPVYMSLEEISGIPYHSTPPLSMRYCPQVRGCQQTLVSMLTKRQSTKLVETDGGLSSFSEENITLPSCSQVMKRSSHDYNVSGASCEYTFAFSDSRREDDVSRADECSPSSFDEVSDKMMPCLESSGPKSKPRVETKKKAKQSQWSQLSLRSFFQKSSNVRDGVDHGGTDLLVNEEIVSDSNNCSNGTSVDDGATNIPEEMESNMTAPTLDQDELDDCHFSDKEKNSALLEWQRIQQLMQNSIPLCKRHGEPCVSRVVKKTGPNFGRRFYVCARSEGSQSNPEANCGYFKWAASKSKQKR